jgi:hypothetical protein
VVEGVCVGVHAFDVHAVVEVELVYSEGREKDSPKLAYMQVLHLLVPHSLVNMGRTPGRTSDLGQ